MELVKHHSSELLNASESRLQFEFQILLLDKILSSSKVALLAAFRSIIVKNKNKNRYRNVKFKPRVPRNRVR